MRVVDLTQPLAQDMPRYPGIPQPSFLDIAEVNRDGFAMSEYHLVNHIGTHVDAPAHQIEDGDTLDDIPLDRLITEAVTLDFRDHAAGPLRLDDLRPHLERIVEGDLVFICSGNDRNWGREAYWTGRDRQVN